MEQRFFIDICTHEKKLAKKKRESRCSPSHDDAHRSSSRPPQLHTPRSNISWEIVFLISGSRFVCIFYGQIYVSAFYSSTLFACIWLVRWFVWSCVFWWAPICHTCRAKILLLLFSFFLPFPIHMIWPYTFFDRSFVHVRIQYCSQTYYVRIEHLCWVCAKMGKVLLCFSGAASFQNRFRYILLFAHIVRTFIRSHRRIWSNGKFFFFIPFQFFDTFRVNWTNTFLLHAIHRTIQSMVFYWIRSSHRNKNGRKKRISRKCISRNIGSLSFRRNHTIFWQIVPASGVSFVWKRSFRVFIVGPRMTYNFSDIAS